MSAPSAVARVGPEGPARFRSLANDLVSFLGILVRTACVHEPANRAFDLPVERFRELAGELADPDGSLRLEASGADLFLNGERLRPQFRNVRAFDDLMRTLDQHRLGGLEWTATPSRAALARLLGLLVAPPRPGAEPVEQFNAELDAQGLGELRALAPRSPSTGDPAGRPERAQRAYQDALLLIREYMSAAHSPEELSLRRSKRIVQQLVDLSCEDGEGFSLAGLAALRHHDEYTFNHMVNVCVLAIAFGNRLGLKRVTLAKLGLAALYHDIGKLHVPCELINKTGGLDEQEWQTMGNHTVYAARTLFPTIAQDPGAVARVLTALQHHRRLDGSGYPPLRLLERQCLFARITAIVDSFDAMTTVRSYQQARLPHQALQELWVHAGRRYDQVLVKAFINCMGVFPIGSAVVLRSGEVGVVAESNPHPERSHLPVVNVVLSGGVRLERPERVDLAAPGMEGRQVARCVDPDEFGLHAGHVVVVPRPEGG